MKKLKIAQVAPLWFSVPPLKYGGTERIISFLSEKLTEKGHRVSLFATANSKTKAKLISLRKKGVIEAGGRWNAYYWNVLNHSMAFEKAEQFDIIHCHWEIMGTYFQRFVKTPVLHTLHNIPGPKNPMWTVFKHYQKDANLVFISQREKKNAVIKGRNNWVIYNGIDLKPFKFNAKPKNHFIWVARVCPEKGIENAIKIAKKAKVKLLMAGQIQAHHQDYFNKKIKPQLGRNIKFIGELNQDKLAVFYRQAKGLLYPINWQEPFGLVIVESMAAGTPVIAFRKGSVPELIKNNKNGFIVNNIAQGAQAVKEIESINRADCRKHIEDNFTIDKMVDNYEKLYYKLLKK